jgi:hypothetical protein
MGQSIVENYISSTQQFEALDRDEFRVTGAGTYEPNLYVGRHGTLG